MANVERTNNRWQVNKLMDFSGYQHSAATKKDAVNNARITIAPALYPVGPDKWAVALLSTVNEMYSGGGAEFSTADFVAIDSSNLGQAKPVHAGIPFSCSRMVRACFKESQYAQSPHCHDETEGTLRITYGVDANSAEQYHWEYLWRETEWPAHTKRNRAKTTSTKFLDGSSKVSMCGGAQ
jgi:hypothetical protein